ncbi:MAG: glycosyltransferase [Chlamydiota bacterium]
MEYFSLFLQLVEVTELSWGWVALFFFAFIFVFFALITTFQMVFGTFAALSKFRKVEVEDVFSVIQSNSVPPITFIIPAYNESKVIVHTVKNFLSLSYRYKKIIIVNDGSSDDTLELLKSQFSLYPVPPSYPGVLPTNTVRNYYSCTEYPNLMVIDKENGGKADALNTALNSCETEVFVAADADTLVDDAQLNRLIRPFFMNPNTLVAHASIGLLNGCKIGVNRILEYIFPKQLISGFQAVDYMKSFLIERMGLSWTKGALVVPGNFGLFKRDAIIELGGYDTTSLVEDTEIITHLHELMLDKNVDYEITYVPDIVAWTAGPENVSGLVEQRLRWYRGTTENIWRYRHMWFNPKYRSIGLFVCPMTVFEKVAPLIEISGFVILFLAAWLTKVNFSIVILISLACWIYVSLLMAYTVLIDVILNQTYKAWSDYRRIAKVTLLYMGYHYILLYCRLRGLYVPKRKKTHWVPYRMEYGKIEKT